MKINPVIEKKPEKVKRMFSQVSYRYDFLNTLLSATRDKFWRRQSIKSILNKIYSDGVKSLESASIKILDICTGTGEMILEFNRLADNQKKIFCIGNDFSPDMLNIAQKKIKQIKVDNFFANFVLADGLFLPFNSNTFDIVTVAFGIRNISKIDFAARDVFRVLKNDGLFAILEFSLPDKFLIDVFYKIYLKSILPVIGALFCRKSPSSYSYLSSSIFDFESNCDLKMIIPKCGFSLIEQHHFDSGIVSLYIFRKTNFKEGG